MAFKDRRRDAPSEPPTEAKSRALALYYLGRRDYAAAQLQRKLVQRGADAEQAQAVVESLSAAGWQSDARYAASWVRARVRQGLGRSRIEAELRQAGIDPEQAAVELADLDFTALAQALRQRRFGAPPTDRREQARQHRFLAYRGFSSSEIRQALRQAPIEPEPDWDTDALSDEG